MTRLRGLLWLTAGLVVAMVAGLVGYNTLNRAVTEPISALQQGGSVPAQVMDKVVVATRPIKAYTLLTAEDLALKDYPADYIPQDAVRTVEDAVGKLVSAELKVDEILYASRLVQPNYLSRNGTSPLPITEDKVLFGVPALDFMSQLQFLKAGDQIDILFSLEFPEERNAAVKTDAADDTQPATFYTLQNITVAAVTGPTTDETTREVTNNQPAGLLLALSPQDALTLKYAINAGGTLDYVLRVPGVDRNFDTQPVDVDYMIERYGIPIGAGE